MKKQLIVAGACLLILFCAGPATRAQFLQENPLKPVKTDNPRETMMTFMEAMNGYREAFDKNDPAINGYIDRAARCLDLSSFSFVDQQQRGREAAILLKEVIDRVIVIDYSLIPEKSSVPGESLLRWRLKGTEITIMVQQSGNRTGEYLFSTDTVSRVREYYELVRHLPYLKGSGGGARYSSGRFEERFPVWMKGEILFLYIWQWASLLAALMSGIFLKVIVSFLLRLAQRPVTEEEESWFSKILAQGNSPAGWLAAVLLWYTVVHLLGFTGIASSVLSVILKVMLSIIILWLAYRMLNVFSDFLVRATRKTESTLDDQLIPLISRAMKVLLVILGGLIIIQNMGVNVVSLLAGLGIGGMAIAFAARDMVANFFGSLMILFDSPFQVGDWIVMGSSEGTVEEIGFRSTKVRTFYNSVISIPNADLATKAVDNMGRREYRRVREVLGITYDTPAEKIEAFLEGIKNIIKNNPATRKDYFHVVFNAYGDSSLNILLYFFLKVPDWSAELVEKQNIMLEILRLAAELKVDFAFPTQTLHIETTPDKNDPAARTLFNLDEIKKTAADFGPGGKSAKPDGLGIYTPFFKEMR
ncbi:MAG: mechanosensitive ion channel family protein [Spirochaetes bacterium]|nr:mechanosensitive ion channel family protein [Spirochaetota bacterium]